MEKRQKSMSNLGDKIDWWTIGKSGTATRLISAAKKKCRYENRDSNIFHCIKLEFIVQIWTLDALCTLINLARKHEATTYAHQSVHDKLDYCQ